MGSGEPRRLSSSGLSPQQGSQERRGSNRGLPEKQRRPSNSPRRLSTRNLPEVAASSSNSGRVKNKFASLVQKHDILDKTKAQALNKQLCGADLRGAKKERESVSPRSTLGLPYQEAQFGGRKSGRSSQSFTTRNSG